MDNIPLIPSETIIFTDKPWGLSQYIPTRSLPARMLALLKNDSLWRRRYHKWKRSLSNPMKSCHVAYGCW